MCILLINGAMKFLHLNPFFCNLLNCHLYFSIFCNDNKCCSINYMEKSEIKIYNKQNFPNNALKMFKLRYSYMLYNVVDIHCKTKYPQKH